MQTRQSRPRQNVYCVIDREDWIHVSGLISNQMQIEKEKSKKRFQLFGNEGSQHIERHELFICKYNTSQSHNMAATTKENTLPRTAFEFVLLKYPRPLH
jgi:hypothetical protein